MQWHSDFQLGKVKKFLVVLTLSAQTYSALQMTLLCQATLIEDLLNDSFDFILTAHFQSDFIEGPLANIAK